MLWFSICATDKRKMKENVCKAIKDSVIFGINSTLLILINPPKLIPLFGESNGYALTI